MSVVMENGRENHSLQKMSPEPYEVEDMEPSYNSNTNQRNNEKSYPYPRGIPFIISTEFCERFSYYGMKTVLSLYFIQVLNYTEDQATMLYSGFNFLCYFTPIIGSIIADSFFGKFKTIFYLAIVYAIGEVVLTVGSIGDTENGNEGIPGLPVTTLSFIGLVLIGLGTGGIKPCVSSFGGEQFKVPEQSGHITTFFSVFYASINAGSLISTLLTPILRADFQCFGEDSCYPLAFGVPAVLMVVAIVFFLCGRVFNLYKLTMPEKNIIVETAKCIWCSFVEKSKRGNEEKLPETLDYAENRFGKKFVADVKALINVTYLFLPFPIFWALYDQQGSRWVFQAEKMNGNCFGYEITADQFQAVNPILILLFIPIFDYIIYPLLGKLRMCRTDLQKIVTGGVLAGVAFIASGLLEMELVATEEDTISMFWQIPQISIMTAGEIMFSITSLKFAFSQAPESMKAVIMAIYLLTDAFGNAITLLLTWALDDVFNDNQLAYNFFLFAGLMFLDMILLAWMATRYQYVDNYNTDIKSKEKEDSKI